MHRRYLTGVVTVSSEPPQPSVQTLEDRNDSAGAFHTTLKEGACLLERVFSGINSSVDTGLRKRRWTTLPGGQLLLQQF